MYWRTYARTTCLTTHVTCDIALIHLPHPEPDQLICVKKDTLNTTVLPQNTHLRSALAPSSTVNAFTILNRASVITNRQQLYLHLKCKAKTKSKTRRPIYCQHQRREELGNHSTAKLMIYGGRWQCIESRDGVQMVLREGEWDRRCEKWGSENGYDRAWEVTGLVVGSAVCAGGTEVTRETDDVTEAKIYLGWVLKYLSRNPKYEKWSGPLA